MAKIISTASQTKETPQIPSWKVDLPTNAYIQIYPRVSTPEQKKNVSAEMQVDKGFALACGWLEELILLDDRDLGVSGQLRMEDRLAFNGMNRNIANGKVKVVLVGQVDRLFRDRWGAEYAKFMEICYTYGVKVVTLDHTRTAIDFVYDFSINWHVDQFRRRCEEAWKYIEGYVYRMLAARAEAAKAGRWTGHNMPVGYMPDLRERIDGKRNPRFKHWIPYTPHLKQLDYLYKRYRQLGGSISSLFREVSAQKEFFPPFEEWVPDVVLTHCRLLMALFDEQEEVDIAELRKIGFTVRSPSGLKSILSNAFNGGMLVYQGVLINSEDHDPATSLGMFLYAYNRLSPTNLDGTPNPYVERVKQTYAKRYESLMVAALAGKLESAEENCRIYPRDVPIGKKSREKENPGPEDARKYYAFFEYGQPARQLKYIVPASDIDECFFTRLMKRLQETKDFTNFLQYERQEQARRAEEQAQIERDILATQAAMRRLEQQAKNGELTNALLAKAANESYGNLEKELARLEGKKAMQEAAASKAKRRMGYKRLMKKAGDRWKELVIPEDLPELVDTFVEKVIWEMPSPHFYTLTIHWRDPEWGVETLLCFRENHSVIRWTDEENALLAKHYETATAEELLVLFPLRTPMGIYRRAKRLGITHHTPKDWVGYTNNPDSWSQKWGNHWTEAEETILAQHYETATAEELIALLPGRTPRSIASRAIRLNLTCETPKDWRVFATNSEGLLTPKDREIMKEHKITEEVLRGPSVKLIKWWAALKN